MKRILSLVLAVVLAATTLGLRLQQQFHCCTVGFFGIEAEDFERAE